MKKELKRDLAIFAIAAVPMLALAAISGLYVRSPVVRSMITGGVGPLTWLIFVLIRLYLHRAPKTK